MSEESVGLFIFRRDLRTSNNCTLKLACKNSDKLYCAFIIDDKQVDKKKNPFISYPAIKFMIESINNLQEYINLNVLQGNPVTTIMGLVKEKHITDVYFNRDYTPYSVERDELIIKSLEKMNVNVHAEYNDICIVTPLEIKPYKKFTPYYNVASTLGIPKVYGKLKDTEIKKIKKIRAEEDSKIKFANLDELENEVLDNIIDLGIEVDLLPKGGRDEAIKVYNRFKRNIRNYDRNRNHMGETSGLSPYIKFGCIGANELANGIDDEMFTRQLYWRDFYLQVNYHFDVYNKNFRGDIKWVNDKKMFKAWCDGKTGFEFIDAAMCQLNKSGYMHNRGRMVTSNFLTKILKIDWRWGEKYFASRLVDYDPSNNNGGWQWSAGTGCDAYNRIFNPYTQQKKYDPDKIYIHKWLGDREPIEEIIDYREARG